MNCFRLLVLLLLSPNMVISQLYPEERASLLLLRDSLTSPTSDLHGNWTGPPCIDNLSRWKGIICFNWHVVHIVLEGFELIGYLPPAFPQNVTFLTQLNLRNNSISGTLPNLTNLVFLEHVLLSYNRFYASIPAEYAGLPGLKELELQMNYLDGQIPGFDQASLNSFNVSYNHLTGPIPQTSVLQKFPKSSFDNNSDLCGKPLDILCPSPEPSPSPAPSPEEPKENKRLPIWIIALIIAAPVMAFLIVTIVFFLFCNKRLQAKETTKNESPGYGFGAWAKNMMSYSLSNEDAERSGTLEIYSKEYPIFELDDLLRASAEMLGKGNLGTTYKATLESGAVVAVKRLDHMNGLGKKELFLQHMQLQARLKHENLVEIISFYYSEEQKLVVYEFIPSCCSLFELLHESRGVGRTPLDWSTRLSIIKDIARGLAFLHHSLPSQKVPHANLRTTNVLIHQDSQGYHSKLRDFGFLPLLSAKKSAEKLAVSKSPEFARGKKLTHKADVYCFGIIILEVITGKVPGESLGEIEETSSDISEWVRTVVNNDWSTDILDAEILAAREGHGAMFELTEIALLCTDMTPERRPKMNEVLARIEEIEQMKSENE